MIVLLISLLLLLFAAFLETFEEPSLLSYDHLDCGLIGHSHLVDAVMSAVFLRGL